MFKHMLWDLRSTFFGPYPSFFIEKSLRSGNADGPEWRFYLWVRPARFTSSILAASGASHKELAPIRAKWLETENYL